MPGRTIAIGDIHGCAALFAQLLDAIAPTPADTLILLGDYVDRGPDTKNTLNLILELRKDLNTICLRGNHDLWMVKARDHAKERAAWMQVGGAQTLGSYGNAPGRSGSFDDVPEAHWDLLEHRLVNWHETVTHIFAHAQVAPDVPMPEQDPLWLFWESLTGPVAHVSGKTLICGHTSQKSGKVLDLGTTICIDTYCYGGGNLTALDVNTRHVWQADILGRVSTFTLSGS
jgi:serine/threonine protein phosphatase 1